MPWAKLDDNLHANEKMACVSLAATGLWTLALSWTTQQLKDGFVPLGILRRFAGSDLSVLAGELVAAGLWIEAEGGYIFHDYLTYNPPAEKVIAEREAAKDRMSKRRTPAPEQAPVDGEANNSARSSDVRPNFARTSPVFGSCSPSPDPVPGTSKEVQGGETREAPKRPLPESRPSPLPPDWSPPKAIHADMAQECPCVDLEVETRKFCDHWRSTGERRADWNSTWRNWIRRSVKDYQDSLGRSPTKSARPTLTEAIAHVNHTVHQLVTEGDGF